MTKAAAGVGAILVALALVALCLVTAMPARAAAATEEAWGDGQVWLMIHGPTNPSNAISHRDLYLVAPQTATPQGSANEPIGVVHDHVLSMPSDGHGEYTANWDVVIAFCNPHSSACVVGSESCPSFANGLCLAKSVNGQALTSVAAIEAAASVHDVILVEPGGSFVCTVVPLTGW
ncbi:MAG TPA: hypothetical protein VEY12_11955 [Thermoplasmata archaeon]|nr:hypothetical protein [Thermoplasmata archaeon]